MADQQSMPFPALRYEGVELYTRLPASYLVEGAPTRARERLDMDGVRRLFVLGFRYALTLGSPLTNGLKPVKQFILFRF